MKRSIEKLITEYDKKFGDTNNHVREILFIDDMRQILDIANEKMKGRNYCSVEELMIETIITSWKAGVITGAKRKNR